MRVDGRRDLLVVHIAGKTEQGNGNSRIEKGMCVFGHTHTLGGGARKGARG